jgi:hypothetical protein
MASIIRIKRSSTAGNPTTLGAGELAYSALTNNDSNGGDRLYIGIGTETAGDAANHLVIGGKYFTDLLDHTRGTLTASSALITDANSKLDNLKVDNLDLNGNTISTTDTNGNLTVAPNGTGSVLLTSSNASSSTSTGALVVTGGVGIGGALYVGGSIDAGAADFASLNNTPIGNATPSTGAFTQLDTDNIRIDGNTISSTDTNGNITLTPNGTGKLVLNNAYINGTSDTLAEFIYDTVGGAITAGTGITVTNNDGGNTSTVSLSNQITAAGPVGSSTAIPVITFNAQGQLTTVTTAAISTTLGIAGDTGTDSIALATDTITFAGGTGLTSTVNSGTNTVTFDIDNTVVTLDGTQTLTNKTLTNPTISGVVVSDSSITFEGATANDFETTLTVTDPTADRTVTIPDATGTVVLADLAQTLTNKTINLANNTLTTTSAQLATAISDETGTGVVVFSNTPTLVTPVLGVATATSINKVAITAPATGSTLTIADGKTLTASNTLTFTGTDTSSVAFGAGGTVAYVANKLSVFAATTSSELAGVISDETGTGALVFANTPTLVTPVLGAATATSITATSGNLTLAAAAGNNSVSITPTGTGTVDVASKRITSLADPTQAQDAATKAYVDSLANGLDVKQSVRAASTSALTATYSNGSSGVGATLTNAGTQAALTLDSIALSVGNRVLIKDQSAEEQNGVYTVTTVGTISTNWVLTRATDFDNSPGTEVGPGVFFFVEEGTTQQDNGYVISTDDAITIGTSPIMFSQFSGAGQITAGEGLTKTGNTLNVVGTNNRIDTSSDAVDISINYVGQTSITTLGTIGTGTWQGTVIGATYGGTGVNNGSSTITLGGNLTTSGAHTTTLTTTANTTLTLPVTGTLATLAGTETLSSKTITGSSIGSSTPSTAAFTTLAASGAVTFTSATDASNLTTAAVVLSGGLSVTKAMYVGTNITGAGAGTSTLDGFNIDGGTY